MSIGQGICAENARNQVDQAETASPDRATLRRVCAKIGPRVTMAETRIPAALTETVAALWRIPRPGPDNLFSDTRFIRLRDTCHNLHPNGGPKGPLDFALYNALRALGLPSSLA
jgi:hypothetical protein